MVMYCMFLISINPVCNYNTTPICIDWLYLVNGDRAGHLLLWEGSYPPTLHACMLLLLLLPLLLGRGVLAYPLPTNICCYGGVCSPYNYCLQLLLQLVRRMYIPSLDNYCWHWSVYACMLLLLYGHVMVFSICMHACYCCCHYWG